MKKLFFTILILFIMYFVTQIGFTYFGKGKSIEYAITTNNMIFNVKETGVFNNKEDEDNYTLSISSDTYTYELTIYENLLKSSKIINDIEYYKDDEYECILPIYINKSIYNDILCNNKKYIIAYHNINDPNQGLKEFVGNLYSTYPDLGKYIDNSVAYMAYDKMYLYKNNNLNGHFLGILYNNYLYKVNTINNMDSTHLILNGAKDIVFTNDKLAYINQNDNKVYYYSITSSKNSSIAVDEYIKNAKYLGYYNNSLYYYSSLNGSEYEIDLDTNNVLEVGNASTSIKYYADKEWKHSKVDNLNMDSIIFDLNYKNEYVNNEYSKIVKMGNKYGYYYFFKKDGNSYEVYKANIENPEVITYIFTTTNIEEIGFEGRYIYYIYNDEINYYSEKTGNKKLVKFDRALGNAKIQIYIDKLKEDA